MRKIASLVVAVSLIGSALAGGSAMAWEGRDVRVERRVVEPVVAPPIARVEHVGYRPGYVWIGGEYQWQGGSYVFAPGRYERERPGFRWVGSAWAHEGGRYVRAPGRWVRGR